MYSDLKLRGDKCSLGLLSTVLQLILWNMDVYYFAEFWELSGLKMFVEADECWAVNKFLGRGLWGNLKIFYKALLKFIMFYGIINK